MRAMVQTRYGPPSEVLHLTEVPRPEVGPDDVLVRVRAGSANPWDWHFVRGWPLLMRPAGLGGVRRPKFPIPGGDVAGTVEQVGGAVTGLCVGDRVYGFGHGTFAEFVAVPCTQLAAMPTMLSYEQAAAVPLGGCTALEVLRAACVAPDQRVLVIGGTGGVGAFAVQLAGRMGAEVTAVCSTGNRELAASLGADHVIDYTARGIADWPTGYDVVVQLGGTYTPLEIRRILTRKGTLIQSYGDGNRWIGPLGSILSGIVLTPFVGQRLKSYQARTTTDLLDELRELIDAGELRVVVDRVLPLAESAHAIELVEQGGHGGKVVVQVAAA